MEAELSEKSKEFYLESNPWCYPLSGDTSADRHIKIKAHYPACNLRPDNIRHWLFECPIAVEVWNLLGLYDEMEKALLMNRSEEVILEFLLSLPDNHIHVLGLPKFIETITICCWFLRWERGS